MELTFKKLDKEIAGLFSKDDCFIEVLPGNVILPRKYMEIGESIRNFKTYSDDVWLISYPRTGSTWAQEMIWLLGNKLDFEGAKQMQYIRSTLIELSALFSEDHHEWVASSLGDTVEAVKNMPRPRFARSHLPRHLLPRDLEASKAKIIYTARNPKDLCVSYYHYCKLMHELKCSFDEFLDLFINEQTPIGSYWKHVLPFWKLSTDPNVLFLKYEDMKRDLPAVVRKCANFLKLNYEIDEKDMKQICDHLKFDNMQSNPAVNMESVLGKIDANGNKNEKTEKEESKFIRKGQIGDWKNYISTEMSKRFDKWIENNSRGSGLTFDYD